jgi:hypothetical protein
MRRLFGALCLALLAASATPVQADAEYVGVAKMSMFADTIIVVRANREIWTIEVGAGCPALRHYKKKAVVIRYSGFFGSSGSELLLPDDDQHCPIWTAHEMR